MLALVGLDGWSLAILAAGGYVAVMALVRLMRRRRDAILEDMGRQIRQEQERREEQKRHEEQRKLREQFRRKRSQQAA